jgi:hypothetical protein
MRDIDLINEIHDERIYDSPVALEFKISKFQDKRLANGLIVDLFCKSEDYDADKENISKFIDLEKSTDDSIEDHTYYINFIRKQPKPVFYDYITSRDIGYCSEFQSWIKNLSNNDFEEVIEYCIELEIYEAIDYIKSLR